MGASRACGPRCVKYLDDLMHFDWTNACVELRETPLIYQVLNRSCSSDTVRQTTTGQTGKDTTATFELFRQFTTPRLHSAGSVFTFPCQLLVQSF